MRGDGSLSKDTAGGNGEKGKHERYREGRTVTTCLGVESKGAGRNLDDSQVSGLDLCMDEGANSQGKDKVCMCVEG